MEDHTIADFDNLFATNVRAPFFLVQQLIPLLGEGSSVIVTTSLAARVSPGSPGQEERRRSQPTPQPKAHWKRS